MLILKLKYEKNILLKQKRLNRINSFKKNKNQVFFIFEIILAIDVTKHVPQDMRILIQNSTYENTAQNIVIIYISSNVANLKDFDHILDSN